MEFWTYYRIVRKSYRTILLGVGVAVALAILATLPHLWDYSANVTFTTSPAEENQYLIVLNTDRPLVGQQDPTPLITELLQSRTLAERVIQRLNLSTSPQDLRSRIQVTSKGGNFMTLTVRDRNPAAAVLLANTYANAAVAYVQEVNRRATTLARQFLQQQLEDTHQRLSESENKLNTFMAAHGIVSMKAQVDAEAQHLTDMANEQRALVLSDRETSARIAAIRQRLRQFSPLSTTRQFTENPVAQKLKGDLAGLQVQLAVAQEIYTGAHPQVIALKQQIAAVNDALAREAKKVVSEEFVQVNPVYEGLVKSLIELETQRVGIQARLAALASVLPDQQKRLPVINETERQFNELSRDRQILEASYTSLETRLNDFRIQEEASANRTLLTVVDQANGAQGAVTTRTFGQVGLAGILGALGGIGLAFFQYQIDDTVKTARDAERLLGLPVLASVPKHNPPFDEAYRMLKTSLGLHARNGAPKALMFTSPRPGSGTSTVVFHLAQAIARGGKRVIVVDADLRRPSVRRLYGAAGQHDLIDVLTGAVSASDALCASTIENLRVLPAGSQPGEIELADLFGSEEMKRLLAELKRDADVVLLDAPPIFPFAEARALAKVVDGVIVVMAAGVAPRGLEQDTRRLLERSHVPVLGTVVNKVALDIDDSYFIHEKYAGSPKPPASIPPAAVATGLMLTFFLGIGLSMLLAQHGVSLTGDLAQRAHALLSMVGRNL